MRFCNKCQTSKDSADFYKKYGPCKECHIASTTAYKKQNQVRYLAYMREYALNNKERIQGHKRKWAAANPEKCKLSSREWVRRNKAICSKNSRQYLQKNLSRHAAYQALRRGKKLRATPSWLTVEQKNEILVIYKLRELLQSISPEVLNVDHIVPLLGKNVCGLHVPWNLQIIPASINLAKGNR